jgi:hypothetical protein
MPAGTLAALAALQYQVNAHGVPTVVGIWAVDFHKTCSASYLLHTFIYIAIALRQWCLASKAGLQVADALLFLLLAPSLPFLPLGFASALGLGLLHGQSLSVGFLPLLALSFALGLALAAAFFFHALLGGYLFGRLFRFAFQSHVVTVCG